MTLRTRIAISLAAALALLAGCSTESIEKPPVIPEERVDLPDPAFRQFCLDNYDYNGDGELTNYELMIVVDMDVSARGIRSLEGIGAFSRLQNLDCSGNDLGTLALGECKMLASLKCVDCHLSSLDLEGCERLRSIDCSDNPSLPRVFDLRTVPALLELTCSRSGMNQFSIWEDSLARLRKLVIDDVEAENKLRDLTIMPHLQELSVRGNGITTLKADSLYELKKLNISGNEFRDTYLPEIMPALTRLEVADTYITRLDLSLCPAIDTLICPDNMITILDVSNSSNIAYLDCRGNLIGKLEIPGGKLRYLDCGDNVLDGIDLERHTVLEELRCNDNQFFELDLISNIGLRKLDCRDNLKPDIKIYVWPQFDESAGEYLKDAQATFIKKDKEPIE